MEIVIIGTAKAKMLQLTLSCELQTSFGTDEITWFEAAPIISRMFQPIMQMCCIHMLLHMLCTYGVEPLLLCMHIRGESALVAYVIKHE